MQLIEESAIAQCAGDNKKALFKAKEASNKERSLIRFQEQAGLDDHNSDLTYVVSVPISFIMLKHYLLPSDLNSGVFKALLKFSGIV